MKMPLLLCSVLAVALWIALRDHSSVDHSWWVSVSRDGQTIEESEITCSESVPDTTRRVRVIVEAHVVDDSPKTAQFKIWRSYSQPFQYQAGQKLSATYTQTESIGPVYASRDPDGFVRVYQEDTPGKPEIMAEERQMDLALKQSIITRVLADRVQGATDYERTRKP